MGNYLRVNGKQALKTVWEHGNLLKVIYIKVNGDLTGKLEKAVSNIRIVLILVNLKTF
jgi:hypothetical protein